MLGGEQPTPFDVRFRLGPIPVRISPWFWLINGLLGSTLLTDARFGPKFLLIWVAVVSFSILIHELGHALAYRMFGSTTALLLYGFGGLAFGSDLGSPVKRMVVALSGPFAQFLIAGVVFGSGYLMEWQAANLYALMTYRFLLWVNIFWALFNLLPILPLDGGNVCRELLTLFRARNPEAGAAAISVAVAGGLAITAIAMYLNIRLPFLEKLTEYFQPGPFMTFWLVLFAIENYQRYQLATRMRPRYYDDDDTPPWRRR
jgi:stage IV sporulation protein FB